MKHKNTTGLPTKDLYSTLVHPCVPRAPPISVLFLHKLKSVCSFTELFKILRKLTIDTPIWKNRLFTLSWYCQHQSYEHWYSVTLYLKTFRSYITENTALFHKPICLNHGFASNFAGAVKPPSLAPWKAGIPVDGWRKSPDALSNSAISPSVNSAHWKAAKVIEWTATGTFVLQGLKVSMLFLGCKENSRVQKQERERSVFRSRQWQRS